MSLDPLRKPPFPDSTARLCVIGLALAALTAKVYCAAVTLGTSDVLAFYKFAVFVHNKGLIATYLRWPDFNHPPLVGWYIGWLYSFAGESKDFPLFTLFLRLPAILADSVSIVCLLCLREKFGKPSWPALALFAASPVAFMISGYHGNIDSVVACGALLAAAACAWERPALCGALLGITCSVKIVPLVLLPAFFFYWLGRGAARRFSLPVGIAILAGWSVPLFGIPGTFLKNVLSYPSFWGIWGLPYLIRFSQGASAAEPTFFPAPVFAAVATVLKVGIVAGVLWISWKRRSGPVEGLFRTLAYCWALFFVLTPGFGPQYLVWLAPSLLLASEGWYAAITIASSVALFVFYNTLSGGIPWYSGYSSPSGAWQPWFLLPWGAIAVFSAASLWRLRKGAEQK